MINWYLLVQSQQWKHQNNVSNLLSVQNDVIPESLLLTLNRSEQVEDCSGLSIVDFEAVNTGSVFKVMKYIDGGNLKWTKKILKWIEEIPFE